MIPMVEGRLRRLDSSDPVADCGAWRQPGRPKVSVVELDFECGPESFGLSVVPHRRAANGADQVVLAGEPREHRQRFWQAVADGFSSEDAGVVAGVSPAVETRWFREGGGMRSVSHEPLSGRYLSFAERVELRSCAPRERCAGGRAAHRPCAVDDFTGVAP